RRRSADVAQILRDNNVGLNLPQLVGVKPVKTIAVGRELFDLPVDFIFGQPRWKLAVNNHRLGTRFGGVIALEGHSKDRFAEPKCEQDFGSRRQEGTDLHFSPLYLASACECFRRSTREA